MLGLTRLFQVACMLYVLSASHAQPHCGLQLHACWLGQRLVWVASATCTAGPLRIVLGAHGGAPCMILVEAVDSAGGAPGQQIDRDNWVGTGT